MNFPFRINQNGKLVWHYGDGDTWSNKFFRIWCTDIIVSHVIVTPPVESSVVVEKFIIVGDK
jgi:hypothetical protein